MAKSEGAEGTGTWGWEWAVGALTFGRSPRELVQEAG